MGRASAPRVVLPMLPLLTPRRAAHAMAALALAGAGCGWDQLDAVSAVDAAQAVALSDVALPDVAVPTDAAQGGSSVDEGAEAAHAEAAADQDASSVVSSAACMQTGTPTVQWTFDSTLESWTSTSDTGVQTALSWTGTLGQPTPGAVHFEDTPRASDAGSTSGAWVENDAPPGNLAGRTIAAWVYLESGPSPQLKVFAQTGPQYIWADNGTVHLAPQTWTCVSLPLSSPSFSQPDFDPTNVIRLGFEMLATEPFHIDFDSVTVY